MKYERCPICDIKLKNGVCPMCGYDFKRLESAYHKEDWHWDILERDQKTQKPVFSHDKRKCKTNRRSSKPKNWKNRGGTSATSNKEKKKKGGIKWLTIIFIVISIFGDFLPDIMSAAYDIKDEIVYKITGEAGMSKTSSAEHDPYKYVTYDLSEKGEHFETELTAGEYIVGVDLPEGIYKISSVNEKNSLMIRNRKQEISEYDFYKIDAEKDDDFYKTSMEVHLYQGTYLKIDYNGILKFETETGQTKIQEKRVRNSLNKSVLVKKTMTAGKDFPAGTYDIYCLNGRGTVQTKYQAEKDGYEYTEEYYLEKSKENSSLSYPEVQKQVYFYPGMKVILDKKSVDIKLVPSKNVVPEGFKIYRYYEDTKNE